MNRTSSRRSFIGFLGGSVAGSAGLVVSCANAVGDAHVQAALTPSTAPPSWSQVFGTEPGLARLHKNENPYGPSPKVQQAIRDVTAHSCNYASTDYLDDMIAERHRVAKTQVLVSSGSIESLTAAALAWGRQGKILCPDLFWDEMVQYAEKQGATLKRVRLNSDMRVDLAKLESELDDGVSLIHLCNPNNPTGLLLDPDELRAFCRRLSPRVTIMIDEAYNEITDEPERNSMMDLVRDGQNVIIARTFSKIYGMAGMRVGYMISTPQNIERVAQHQMCWVAAPAVAAAIAALNDEEFLARSKAKIIEAREMLTSAVEKAGLRYLPSQTSFLYVDVGKNANDFQKKMQDKGVLIRGIYRDYATWSRVSAGHLRDVERYVKALPEVAAS